MQKWTRKCGGARCRALALAFAGTLVFGAMAAPDSVATTVVRLSDDALADNAVRIVHGVVTASTAHALPDKTGYYTEYRIRVTEALKGVPSGTREIVFREWGARMPSGKGYWIPGTGKLAVGEEAVLFLGALDGKTQVGFTTGLAQGKFHIHTEGGQKVATRSFKGLSLVGPGGTPTAPRFRTRKLADLTRLIRVRVKAHQPRPSTQGANHGR